MLINEDTRSQADAAALVAPPVGVEDAIEVLDATVVLSVGELLKDKPGAELIVADELVTDDAPEAVDRLAIEEVVVWARMDEMGSFVIRN